MEVIGTIDKIALISSLDNSLMIDDLNMTNIDTLKPKGLKEANPDRAAFTSYVSIQDPNIILWPCGNSDLAIVDIVSFEFDVVGAFFAGDDRGYLPISLKSSNNGRKVIGLSMLKLSQDYVLAYWNKVKGEDQIVTTRSIKMLDFSCRLLSCSKAGPILRGFTGRRVCCLCV